MESLNFSSFNNLLLSSSQLSVVESCRGKKVKFSEGGEISKLYRITRKVKEMFTSLYDANSPGGIRDLENDMKVMKDLIFFFKALDENCGRGCFKKVSRVFAMRHRVKGDIASMETVLGNQKSRLFRQVSKEAMSLRIEEVDHEKGQDSLDCLSAPTLFYHNSIYRHPVKDTNRTRDTDRIFFSRNS